MRGGDFETGELVRHRGGDDEIDEMGENARVPTRVFFGLWR